jgi:transcriptional regulator with XRE-family HTH domain
MVTERYKRAFGRRVTRLVKAAGPRLQEKYPQFNARDFGSEAERFHFLWHLETPTVAVSLNAVKAWFAGTSVAKGKRLERLAQLLGVTTDYLLEGDLDEHRPDGYLTARQDIPAFGAQAVNEDLMRLIREMRNATQEFSSKLDEIEGNLGG